MPRRAGTSTTPSEKVKTRTSPGMTDASLAALNTRYAGESDVSQNTRLVQAIGNQWAAGHTIGDVTISLGANDLLKLANDPNFQSASASDRTATAPERMDQGSEAEPFAEPSAKPY